MINISVVPVQTAVSGRIVRRKSPLVRTRTTPVSHTSSATKKGPLISSSMTSSKWTIPPWLQFSSGVRLYLFYDHPVIAIFHLALDRLEFGLDSLLFHGQRIQDCITLVEIYDLPLQLMVELPMRLMPAVGKPLEWTS
jgi:hypothetical protein